VTIHEEAYVWSVQVSPNAVLEIRKIAKAKNLFTNSPHRQIANLENAALRLAHNLGLII
jgi:hypothetical protein